MSAQEVWRRARIAVRDRFQTLGYARLDPGEAFDRLYEGTPEQVLGGSRLGSLVHIPMANKSFEATLGEAERLRRAEWSCFGRTIQLDDPPNWRKNYMSGQEWPNLPSRRLDYRRTDFAGDAKYTWEVGRLTLLPSLALAHRLTREQEYADRALRWMRDFAAQNPLGHGLHQTSGIEMAVRVLTCSFALALLHPLPRRLSEQKGEAGGSASKAGELRQSGIDSPDADEGVRLCLGLMAQQALHCRDHLSLGSSANNHLIAEYAAMAMMGALFPALRDADDLLKSGVTGLEQETMRQINPDGTSVEQAFGYIPFIWELILYPLVVAEGVGRRIRPDVKERLRASLEFARSVRLPSGATPQVGDEDDGRVLLSADEPRLDLVGNALAVWLDAPGLHTGSQALALLLLGRGPESAEEAPEGRCDFPQGGYTVWRHCGLHVTFDQGPLGWGTLAAHGHADALSLTIFRNGDPLIVDPGVYAYYGDREARDRFRSTPYHSTVHFGGRSQSEMLGPFLWGKRAQVVPKEDGFECEWFSGERHWRHVEVEPGRVRIEDRVAGEGAEILFVLHPSAEVRIDGGMATVRAGGSEAVFEAEGLEAWRAEPGEYSPRYGQRHKTLRLTARFALPHSVTAIRLRDA